MLVTLGIKGVEEITLQGFQTLQVITFFLHSKHFLKIYTYSHIREIKHRVYGQRQT